MSWSLSRCWVLHRKATFNLHFRSVGDDNHCDSSMRQHANSLFRTESSGRHASRWCGSSCSYGSSSGWDGWVEALKPRVWNFFCLPVLGTCSSFDAGFKAVQGSPVNPALGPALNYSHIWGKPDSSPSALLNRNLTLYEQSH